MTLDRSAASFRAALNGNSSFLTAEDAEDAEGTVLCALCVLCRKRMAYVVAGLVSPGHPRRNGYCPHHHANYSPLRRSRSAAGVAHRDRRRARRSAARTIDRSASRQRGQRGTRGSAREGAPRSKARYSHCRGRHVSPKSGRDPRRNGGAGTDARTVRTLAFLRLAGSRATG